MSNITPIRPPLFNRVTARLSRWTHFCRCRLGLHIVTESEEKFVADVRQVSCKHCNHRAAVIPGFMSEQRWTSQLEANLRGTNNITQINHNEMLAGEGKCFSYEIRSKAKGLLQINCSCGNLVMLCHEKFMDEEDLRRVESKLKSAWRAHSNNPDPFG